MAELSTIARPYAEALFAVARADQAGLAAWEDLVSEMAQLAAHPEVSATVADPHLDSKQRLELFISLLKSPLTQQARNFVAVLVENNRLMLLPEISEQYHQLKNQLEATADVKITSAFELTADQLKDLVSSLEHKLGVKNVTPTVHVDPSLIGGVCIVVGDQVLDSSVKAQLTQMRDKLVA